MSSEIATGLTPTEVAEYLRVSPDRVRSMIRRGELGAIDTSLTRCGRPRFIVLPHHLREFERRHAAADPPQPRRRPRKKSAEIDFYPD
jgi:excisionase family DNA binding protein